MSGFCVGNGLCRTKAWAAASFQLNVRSSYTIVSKKELRLFFLILIIMKMGSLNTIIR